MGGEYLRMILFFIETVCCDPSFEQSCRDGLDEGSRHVFLSRMDKNWPQLLTGATSHLELCYHGRSSVGLV